MKDDSDKGEGQTRDAGKNSRQDSRQARLKLALRENLKRRKSQARGRSDAAVPSPEGDGGWLDDGTTKK